MHLVQREMFRGMRTMRALREVLLNDSWELLQEDRGCGVYMGSWNQGGNKKTCSVVIPQVVVA